MEIYDRREERTGVQISDRYTPSVDIQCDFVMVYGLDDSTPERIAKWKEKGYIVHLMTGVAWGGYVDFLDGEYDGLKHWDEGQVNCNGDGINHGPKIPYICPSVAFANYLTEKLKVAVDAGVEAVHLEEPEFWVDGGWSEAFKREWQIFYNEPWQDPRSSAEAQFRASKLKSYLYKRALDRLCCELKEYAQVKHGRNVRFYVATHSLVNYTNWRIVSPESSLIDIPTVDGYIAQIWTGTSRTPNVYEGELKERTFETAFLEYGAMQELTRGTGRRMWFLHDPIEDNPRHTWEDYRYNYYRTLSASLFHYDVHHFEICPWPNRVFDGKYPHEGDAIPMPPEYQTNLVTLMHTLRDMNQPDCKFDGTVQEVGLLLADSGMFQRLYPEGTPEAEDHEPTHDLSRWNSFYGLALPMLKQGLAVRPVQLDNIRRFSSYLDDYKVLVLSYEFMKPENPDIHNALAQWVKDGGLLIYVGDGTDAFHNIRSWWTTGKKKYHEPVEHLFECCGLGEKVADGLHAVGDGYVYYMKVHPKTLALSKEAADSFRDVVGEVLALKGIPWEKTATIILRRGPYVVTAVMDESVQTEPYTMKGTYFDMYTHDLRVVKDPKLEVGSVGLYLDASKIDKKAQADILAVAGRVDDFKADAKACTFKVTGPSKITCAVLLYTNKKPTAVTAVCEGKAIDCTNVYNKETGTTLINFASSPESVEVKVEY